MKKRNFLFIFTLVFILAGTSPFLLNSRLASEILLEANQHTPDFEITVFYSDIGQRFTKGFQITKQTVQTLPDRFKGYTEGFLSAKKHHQILFAVNKFRKAQGQVPLSCFHDFYEDPSFYILSFTGGLENIYVIDKKNFKVSTLKYAAADNLGAMYVSHIRKVQDHLVLIGGEVNAYHAFIYTIDASSLTVKQAVKITTHPSAIHEEHYTIDAMGHAVFINGKGLQFLPFLRQKTAELPLPFEAHSLLSDNEKTIALSLTSSSVKYALFSSTLQISRLGELALPNKNLILVDAFLSGRYLYLITYDGANKLYRNYISSYDLATDQMTYCRGIYQYKNFALLDGILNY